MYSFFPTSLWIEALPLIIFMCGSKYSHGTFEKKQHIVETVNLILLIETTSQMSLVIGVLHEGRILIDPLKVLYYRELPTLIYLVVILD